MKRNKSIYIILSDTGTWFTKCIRLYTKAPFNHASIALDANLEQTYSFGRKDPANPFFGGFVKEDMRNGKLFHNANVAIYRCPVSQTQYEQLCLLLQQFHTHSHLFKYNLLGLFGVMFNFPIKRKHAYFCSQFVASLMNDIGVSLVSKAAALTTPNDIQNCPDLELIYTGKLNARPKQHKSASFAQQRSAFATSPIVSGNVTISS